MTLATRIGLPIAAALFAASTPALAPAAGAAMPAAPYHMQAPTLLLAAAGDTAKINATDAAMRDLWIGHIFWVRNVVISGLAGNTAEQQVAEQQVVANAKAIAATIMPFYGKAGSDQLFTLLANHYGAIKAYLDATIAGSAAGQSAATAKGLANAEAIAVFLSTANPNLPKNAVLGLMQAHFGQHITEIQQLKAKDYEGEATTWGHMTEHVYTISDALVGAIAKQFPQKF